MVYSTQPRIYLQSEIRQLLVAALLVEHVPGWAEQRLEACDVEVAVQSRIDALVPVRHQGKDHFGFSRQRSDHIRHFVDVIVTARVCTTRVVFTQCAIITVVTFDPSAAKTPAAKAL